MLRPLLLAVILTVLLSMENSLSGDRTTDPASQNRKLTFKVNVNLVKVPITVLDEQERTVTGLRKEDFRIYEDGVEQDIYQFVIDTNPVEVVLLLDLSMSVHDELNRIRKAAFGFAKALGGQSKICVIAFSDEVELIQDWTSKLRAVNKALHKISTGFRTSLYDAIYLAADDQLRDFEGKKAIILLTDGIDNESRLSYGQAADAVIRSQASVYVIGLTKMIEPGAAKAFRVQYLARAMENLVGEKDSVKKYFQQKQEELENLSTLTGGRAFFPLKMDEIADSYHQVAQELKNKYFLTYISKNQDDTQSLRKIKVVCRRADAHVLYRSAYYLPK